ncbi:MAG: hypothetical protein JXR58_10730 [Bacteroidales bacterium]|nr:hypothetical protein [Bacteroidales bacterium]
MRKIYALAFILALSVSSMLSQEKTELTKAPKQNLSKTEQPCSTCPSESKLPADFPIYENTGNQQLDEANYQAKKQQWIEQNPERYKAMFPKKEQSEAAKREQAIKEANRNENK